MITVIPVSAFRDNYIWLIHDTGNRAVIVDPGAAAPVLEALAASALEPVAVLATHHHYDHVYGIEGILASHTIPVFGPATEDIPAMDHPLADGVRMSIPSMALHFDVIDIPGHTLGHIAYYGHGMLLCGDTLFAGGCGRLFEGTAAQLYHSLQKLAALPDTTRVYCGHEYTLANLTFALRVEPGNEALAARYDETRRLRDARRPTLPSTIGIEKRTNPFLRCGEPAVRTAAEKYAGRPLATPEQVFAALRSWKDSF